MIFEIAFCSFSVGFAISVGFDVFDSLKNKDKTAKLPSYIGINNIGKIPEELEAKYPIVFAVLKKYTSNPKDWNIGYGRLCPKNGTGLAYKNGEITIINTSTPLYSTYEQIVSCLPCNEKDEIAAIIRHIEFVKESVLIKS